MPRSGTSSEYQVRSTTVLQIGPHHIGPHQGFGLWFGNSLLGKFQTLQEPGHVAAKIAHRLHAFGVLKDLAFFHAKPHVPVAGASNYHLGDRHVVPEMASQRPLPSPCKVSRPFPEFGGATSSRSPGLCFRIEVAPSFSLADGAGACEHACHHR